MIKPYIIANWKMNLDLHGINRFFSRFGSNSETLTGVNVVLCPSFPQIDLVKQKIGDAAIGLGAQNLFQEERGAFTGEVSGQQLHDVGCQFVIVGHSERRAYFQESDEMVNAKVKTALKAGLKPIVCLGESLDEKESGHTKKIIEEKVIKCLDGLHSFEMKKVIIAYEPIWAISTSPENTQGLSDSPESAQVVHKLIRRMVAEMSDEHVAEVVPIIYGGSVNPANAGGFSAMQDINGVLVGGASKEADSFQKIIESFAK